MASETPKCRDRLKHFCVGCGLDLGFGGDPITPKTIRVDLPPPYTHVGNAPLHLAGDPRNLYWFRDNVLDYVYSSHLLEDFENTYEVLKEWLRVIKPGGYLILYCPDEPTYKEHCRKTGQSYNYSHKIKDFGLEYCKKILMDNFINIKIVHEKPLVDVYSFELVVQKLEKEILKESVQPFYQSLNETDSLIPPLEKIFDGSESIEEFIQIGDEWLKYFIYLCKLKPHERILDVGCGIGRNAIPLTKYLSKEGRYEGFDIVADAINWCREKITSKYPNFNFRWADVFNKFYNPNGRYSSSNYKFPYEDESFDFVFLTSVFTHMLPDSIENYLKEIYRVLKKNGRCLITFFLLNDESRSLIQNGESNLDFKYRFRDKKTEYLSTHPNNPEVAVAYEEEFIRDLYKQVKLEIQEPIFWGSWCGRRHFLYGQDIIIAYKDQQKPPPKNYGGHVDIIEPLTPALGSNIHMSGWAADLEKMIPARSVVIISNGQKLPVSPLMGLSREDVAQYWNNPGLTLSGWDVTFNARILGKGKHRLEFYAQVEKNQIKCLFYKTKKYVDIEIID